MAHAFKVHVILSWGEQRDYLVANDVEPGLEHRLATRKNWQEVMRGALINVPVAPYLPSGKPMPPISTAKVVDVVAIPADDLSEGLQRTRSQFIMATVWENQDSRTNYNYLRHDYDLASQRQIKADVEYWCDGVATTTVVAITKARIAAQKKKFQKELGKRVD
ncbi:MAG: hypothetical protein ACLRX6_00575 [Limosilactobacillus pontis]|uniref:Uncharacterized protein n=1 Tax=Limosilactobacillus pontis TaxID=35787 RepID=A0A2J6NND0_9LACO|nr:hypothetical protein [Limosilactobacillus pontis]PMB82837.1 hypothetical protein CK797_03130 [Limosilactobacillus pontis]